VRVRRAWLLGTGLLDVAKFRQAGSVVCGSLCGVLGIECPRPSADCISDVPKPTRKDAALTCQKHTMPLFLLCFYLGIRRLQRCGVLAYWIFAKEFAAIFPICRFLSKIRPILASPYLEDNKYSRVCIFYCQHFQTCAHCSSFL
jgi:hypothetical protein